MFENITNPREIRQRLHMNQEEFWGAIGVTQSGGSRYETGRNMPKAVRELLRLVHIDKIDLRKITRADMLLLAYLRKVEKPLYLQLKWKARRFKP